MRQPDDREKGGGGRLRVSGRIACPDGFAVLDVEGEPEVVGRLLDLLDEALGLGATAAAPGAGRKARRRG